MAAGMSEFRREGLHSLHRVAAAFVGVSRDVCLTESTVDQLESTVGSLLSGGVTDSAGDVSSIGAWRCGDYCGFANSDTWPREKEGGILSPRNSGWSSGDVSRWISGRKARWWRKDGDIYLGAGNPFTSRRVRSTSKSGILSVAVSFWIS